MGDAATGQRRTQRSEATREQLVRAAAALLGARGYGATSLDDVAAFAGVTKGTIYYHFESKEALYWAVVGPLVERGRERMEEIIRTHESPHDTLVAIVRLAISSARSSRQKYLHFQEFLPLDDAMRKAIRENERRYESMVADVIARGQRAGEMVSGDPKMLSLILIGAISRTARWYDRNGPVGPEEFEETLSKMLLHGLLTPF